MNYNKLPFKERVRHAKYRDESIERQEEIIMRKLIKQQEEEKLRNYEEQRATSDKERQHEEVLARLLEMVGDNK